MAQSLPPHERFVRYRDMAADALLRASAAKDPARKNVHVEEAARWLALAVEVEHLWDRLPPDGRNRRCTTPPREGATNGLERRLELSAVFCGQR